MPCQDGFMVLKELYYPEMIQDCEKVMLEKYGFMIPLKVKEFDEAIDIQLIADKEDYLQLPTVEDEYNFTEILSAGGIADFLVGMHHNNIIYDNGIFFVFHNQRWYEGDNIITHLVKTNVYMKS